MEDESNLPNVRLAMKPLDDIVVNKICSGQIITTLSVAIKELIENALDAGAKNVEIRLKDQGISVVEVRDDGPGIAKENRHVFALKNYTSKISNFADIYDLHTYGFRGEAINSLCVIGDVSVITRHEDDEYGNLLVLDGGGKVIEESPHARMVGTTVFVKNIFHPLPVRRKLLVTNIKKEFVKAIDMIKAYCLVCTGVRFICTNQIGEKAPKIIVVTDGTSVLNNISSAFGVDQVKSVVPITRHLPDKQLLEDFRIKGEIDENCVHLDGYISSCLRGGGRNLRDRQFVYVNSRPCDYEKIIRLVNFIFHQHQKRRYPFLFLNLQLPPDTIDVNCSPDKREIILNNERLVLATIKASLLALYRSVLSVSTIQSNKLPSVQFKLEEKPKFKKIRLDSDESFVCKSSQAVTIQSQVTQKNSVSVETSGEENGSNCNTSNQEIEVSTLFDALLMTDIACSSRSLTEVTDIPCCSKSLTQDFSDIKRGKSDQENKVATLSHSSLVNETVCSSNSPNKYFPSRNNLMTNRGDQDNEVATVSGTSLINETACNGKLPRKYFPSKGDFKTNRSDQEIEVSYSSDAPLENATACSRKYIKKKKITSKNILMSSKGDQEYEISNSSDTSLDNETPCSRKPIKKIVTSKRLLMINRSNQENDASTLSDSSLVSESARCTISLRRHFTTTSMLENYKSDDDEEIMYDDNQPYSIDNRKQTIIDVGFLLEPQMSDGNLAQTVELFKEGKNNIRKFRTALDPSQNEKAVKELRQQISKEMFSKMEIVGQLNKSFIIVNLNSDLFIIDQHAADEIYNFEMLMKMCKLQNQRLIGPQELNLLPNQEEIVIEYLEVFNRNGFEFEINDSAPSGEKIRLTSVPVSRTYSFGKQDVEELIAKLEECPDAACRPSRVRTMLATRACRKSVMMGTSLTKSIMRSLVDHMGTMDEPWNCPHGRPTMRHLFDLSQMEK